MYNSSICEILLHNRQWVVITHELICGVRAAYRKRKNLCEMGLLSLYPYLEHWISIHQSVRNVVNKHGSRKWKNKSCIQGVKPNIPPPNLPDCSLYHSRLIVNISLKSIHQFYRNVTNRPTALPRWETVKQTSQAGNSLANYFLCRAWHIMNIFSWKSVHPFLHNITNKHGSISREIDPGPKGLTATWVQSNTLQLSSLFFVLYPTYPRNFMKILFFITSAVQLR